MKFLNFFKTALGITILVILVIAIILTIYNWEAIAAWWNDETPEPGSTNDRGIRPPAGRRFNLKPSARVQALLRGAGLPTTDFVVCTPSGIMDFGGPEACASCEPGDWCNVSQ